MHPYGTVSFYTLGCKLNFSETSAISRSFTEAGYAVVPFEAGADFCVVNTCSVTDHADKKCRNIARRAKNLNPESTVIVIGCYAQLKPEEIIDIPGVNMVLGANEKFNVVEHIASRKPDEKMVLNARIKEVRDFHPAYSQGDRTRSFVKVQDGCDYFCAFCTIPLARGRSRSGTIAQTLETARNAIDGGAKELVLTGVNIGDFGNEQGETFLELIKALDTLQNVQRIRISSIEPNLLCDEIIAFCASSNLFVPHFHIPLQSGSNRILSSMRRRYDTALYAQRVQAIKQQMPQACIGADILVGFPGEGDAEFEETFAFLRDISVDYLHVFTYSERPDTTAVRMEQIVPQKVREERNRRLRILSEKKQRAFYQNMTGKSGYVLWESENRQGFMQGYSENYIRCLSPFNDSKINQMELITYAGIDADGLMRTLPQLQPA
jgi:threonylcarbamoyladenosine tRNA methylthiotransferase MtaB